MKLTKTVRCKICSKTEDVDASRPYYMCKSCAESLAKNSDNMFEIGMLQKYGVHNAMELPENIDKITDTFMHRYGVKRAVHVPEFKQKQQTTNRRKFGVPWYVQTEEYKTNANFRISSINKQFTQMLEQHRIKYVTEFSIESKIFDICLPEHRILIELNPTYTHNVVGNHWNTSGIDSNYHLIKSQLADKHGYRCIHVWDWDDSEKIFNLILPKMRVYARKCVIKEVDKVSADAFLNAYHLQNTCKGQSVRIGLYHNEELIQIMTFGKPRYNKNYAFELLRLCTKSGYTVVGGAKRLYSHAVTEYGVHDVISYCDLSKFSGKVYAELGLSLLRRTSPQEMWSKGSSRISANFLRQRGYDQIFNTHYGKGTSNNELMLKDGWLPVFDCGQAVFASNCNKSCTDQTSTTASNFGTYDELRQNTKSHTKLCEFCGKEFIPKSNFQRYCKEPHYRTCPVCGKTYEETNSENLKRPPKACSYACRAAKTKQTSLEKYGCAAPGNNPEARQKSKDTMLSKFGVEYTLQSDELSKKVSATLQDKYGVTNVGKLVEVQNRRRTSARMTRLNKNPMSKYLSMSVPNVEDTHQDRFDHIVEYLENSNIRYEVNAAIGDREYDVLIPASNLVLCINSTARTNCMHNDISLSHNLNVSDAAAAHNLQCIHIFDWDDVDKVMHAIEPRIDVSSRDFQIFKLTDHYGRNFIDKYSVNRLYATPLLYVGLVKDDKIFQIMAFGKNSKDNSVELLDICTLPRYNIRDGASKLFNWVIQTYEIHDVVAHCDISKSCGNLYLQLGMSLVDHTDPEVVWFNGKSIKSGAAKTLLASGYLPIPNCGYKIFK